jgi:ubiquinone biosynthesis monooxygenase Coq7
MKHDPHVEAGRIMKVNHAGEHGAVSIYAGQIAVARFRAKALLPELAQFKAHEEGHRAIFARELERRGLARCRSYWMCVIGGYTLGIISGLLGEQAIAVTTVAVERVVLRHLHTQLDGLGGRDSCAVAAISVILEEEQQHHDLSAARVKHARAPYRALASIVSAATESVIWIGMRL